MHNSSTKVLLISILSVLVLSLFALPGISVYATTSQCHPAGTTGLTALIVAKPHQTITGTVNAKGCDVGIFVGPGIGGVLITHATVTGANDHGIFAQNTWNLIVEDSLVTGNGVAPHTCPKTGTPTSPCIAEDKAIELVGTSNSNVLHNTVKLNFADGGIGVADDGAIDPGALNPGTPSEGEGNLIAHNYVADNAFGCGIVIAAYNAGEGVAHNVVLNNVVDGSSPGTGPYVGGVVIAADTPGTRAYENLVIGNVIKESLIPGIVVHSNAPGDHVFGTLLLNNKITNNGFEAPPFDPALPTGIEVVAEVPHLSVLRNTWVIGNTITTNHYGVWMCNSVGTHVINLKGNANVPIATCP